MSYVKREEVIGKKAITPDGNTFGSVKDLAFSTSGDVALVISKKDESEVTVSLKQISALGEFILLSTTPKSMAPESAPKIVAQTSLPVTCPACGAPLKQGAKFCGKCGHKLS